MFCVSDVFVNKLMFVEIFSCFLPIFPYSFIMNYEAYSFMMNYED